MKRACWAALLLALAAASIAAPRARKDLTLADTLRWWEFGGQTPRHRTWAADGRSFYYFEPGAFGSASDLKVCEAATLARRTVLTQAEFREAAAKLLPAGEGAGDKLSFERFVLSPKGRFLLLPTKRGAFVWDLVRRSLSLLAASEDHADGFQWSPDESRVAWTSGGSLWVAQRDGSDRRAAAEGKPPLVSCGSVDWLYGEELDMTSGFWWSPDSFHIAFLRFDETEVPTYPIVDQSEISPKPELQFYPKAGDKNPRVTLCVADLRAGATYAVPGADSGDGYLPRAAWAQGGKTLLFETLNRAQDRLVLFRWEAGAPAPATVLEEVSTTWVNVMEGPRVLKDGTRFLWMSERDGWAHLFLAGLDGSLLQLTKGSWVVDQILGVDETRGWVYFSGNRENPLDRQVYRVDLKGRAVTRLTPEEGWHDADLSPDGSWLLDSRSAAGTPDVVTLMTTGGDRRLVVAPNPAPELDDYGFVKPEFFTVTASDGTALFAKIIKPRGFDPSRKYPVIVEVYGGPHMQMAENRWTGRWDVMQQYFVQQGYLWFSVDGRGSFRRGKAFEDALYKRMGKAELEDQLAGVEALKKLPYVDASRIGIWGWSYGGFMTCYALTHAPAGTFRCGAAVAPVTDWLNYDSCYTERYLKLPKENEQGYADSSPVHAAASLCAPFLIAQGLVDDNVHFGNSVQMVDALFAAKKPFEMAYYPKMDHGIRGPDARLDLFTRIEEFFEKNLKGE
jgi:dipeptidyl-peptidase-4